MTKIVLNSHRIGHPGGGRGVEESINANMIPLTHYKSLVRGECFVEGPIDKKLLGKEATIDK